MQLFAEDRSIYGTATITPGRSGEKTSGGTPISVEPLLANLAIRQCLVYPTVGHGIVETTWEANSTFFDENQRISMDFHKFQDFLGASAYRTRSRDFYIELCLTEH